MKRLLLLSLLVLCATLNAASYAELFLAEHNRATDDVVREVYYGPNFIGPICPVPVPLKPQAFDWQLPTNSTLFKPAK